MQATPADPMIDVRVVPRIFFSSFHQLISLDERTNEEEEIRGEKERLGV